MVQTQQPKKAVLLLTHRIPYPPNKGDKIRSWRLLQRLAARFDVHLGCFIDDADDWRYRDKVAALCKSAHFAKLDPRIAKLRSAWGLVRGTPLTLPYYMDHGLRRWVEAVRREPLAAEIAFSSSMAAYLEKPAGARPRLVDLCDADSAKWTQYAAQKSGPMAWVYGREGRHLQRYEHEVIDWADAAFAISPAEAAVLAQGRTPGPSKPQTHSPEVQSPEVYWPEVHWYGNGVDSAFFDPALSFPPLGEAADIVFVGMMDYWANVDAVQWFMDACWARVRSASPKATLAIVGARPPEAIQQLSNRDGVRVTGWVEDVRPWLQQAKVVIAPMRIARGVQNKVLEAMAMACPVVATSAAAEGLALEQGAEILVEDDPEAFAKVVVSTIDHPESGAAIGAAARARVLDDYIWPRQLDRFDAVLDQLLSA